ncbi:MAG: Dabb family protein [Flavobacteriales bacterium]|nr:Dabb family protein [Flavobacteriales bacterium]
MVKHIVMFKLKAEAKKDAPERAKKELEAMMGVAPTLRSMEVGIDFSSENPTADLVLTSTFDDVSGLKAYAVDPVHLAFLEWFRPLITIRTVVDYQY